MRVLLVAAFAILLTQSVLCTLRAVTDALCTGTPSCDASIDAGHVVFDQDDQVSIMYLEAPLMEKTFGDMLGRVGLKHVGVGLKSFKTQKNYTLEYVGKYGFVNATIPLIIPDGDSKRILWCNDGQVCWSNGINTVSWNSELFPHAKITEVTKVDGKTANTFMAFAHGIINDAPLYDFWHVLDYSSSESYLSPFTCQVFAQRMFEKLYELGAKYNCSEKYFGNDQIAYSKDYKLVDPNNPVTKNQIINFYSLMQMPKGLSIAGYLERFSKLSMVNPKFIYSNGKYYKINLQVPFLGPKILSKPFPGCPNQKIQIEK